MSRLPETTLALSDMAANWQFGIGEHTDYNVRAGVPGMLLGTVDFDPVRHFPSQINWLAEGFTDTPQVSQVFPDKPLKTSVITQFTQADEHPLVARAKQTLQMALAEAIDDAVPGMTDHADLYAIGNSIPKISHDYEVITTKESDAEASGQLIAELATSGLTFVIGDLRNISLPEERFDSLVAIKVNHPAERALPAGMGFVSLGGLIEVDTNKPAQLDKVNGFLENRHLEIVDKFATKGVPVVELIAYHDESVISADPYIAEAVGQIARA